MVLIEPAVYRICVQLFCSGGREYTGLETNEASEYENPDYIDSEFDIGTEYEGPSELYLSGGLDSYIA